MSNLPMHTNFMYSSCNRQNVLHFVSYSLYFCPFWCAVQIFFVSSFHKICTSLKILWWYYGTVTILYFMLLTWHPKVLLKTWYYHGPCFTNKHTSEDVYQNCHHTVSLCWWTVSTSHCYLDRCAHTQTPAHIPDVNCLFIYPL